MENENENRNENVKFQITEFEEKLLTDEIWQMQCCALLKLSKEKLLQEIITFIAHIKAAPETYDNLDRCKAHFIHRYQKHAKNTKPNSRSQSPDSTIATSYEPSTRRGNAKKP